MKIRKKKKEEGGEQTKDLVEYLDSLESLHFKCSEKWTKNSFRYSNPFRKYKFYSADYSSSKKFQQEVVLVVKGRKKLSIHTEAMVFETSKLPFFYDG